MKVVLIGGTGLIGSKLIEKLKKQGIDAVVASRSTGVNVLTGVGLSEALQGADVVVDVLNSPSFEVIPNVIQKLVFNFVGLPLLFRPASLA